MINGETLIFELAFLYITLSQKTTKIINGSFNTQKSRFDEYCLMNCPFLVVKYKHSHSYLVFNLAHVFFYQIFNLSTKQNRPPIFVCPNFLGRYGSK